MPNDLEAKRRAKSGEKREGADSQNGGHFAGGPPRSDAALAAGAAHRDSKAPPAPKPVMRRAKRSEKFRVRLTDEELDGLHALAARTGINRCRLARKALRELITGNVDLLDREQQAVLELARQMRLIGVNLNQVARQLNRGDDPGRALAETIEKLAAAYSESEFTWRRLVATARARTVPEHGRA